MASFVAARSVLRSVAASGRGATARRCASGSRKPRASPSPFRVSSQTPARCFRLPVEISFFSAMSMLPYHTATASAVLTSMLSLASCSHAWTLDGL